MFVKTAVNIPTDRTFVYSVPSALESTTTPGKRALVPFGRRTLAAYILEVLPDSDHPETKDIIRILDPEPLFDPEDLAFYKWLSGYYLQPLGKILAEALPSGITPKTERVILPAPGCDVSATEGLSEKETVLMNFLRDTPGGISWEKANQLLPGRAMASTLAALQERGFVVVEERVKHAGISRKMEKWLSCSEPFPDGIKLTARQQALLQSIKNSGEIALSRLKSQRCYTPSLLDALKKKGGLRITSRETFRGDGTSLLEGSQPERPILNGEQVKAVRKIGRKLSQARFSVCLLHGVTGSGKTEVYLNAMEEALRSEGGVLFLVPEISLTTQLMERIRSRFPEREIAVLHSDIPGTIRYDWWRRIRRGDIKIVVGARSAVFAPVKRLRLIIVDEEHDGSYKQDERTRYNGRDAAIIRGRISGATVVLGSATPGLQTYYYTRLGKYAYLSLPNRVENRPLPKVEVVCMDEEKDETGAIPILSAPLVRAMSDSLAQGCQTLLFLNRRGFHTFFYCPDCRHVLSCPHCTVSLTFHADTGRLHCHYCDHNEKMNPTCPACGGGRVLRYGAGTERLEAEVMRHFPHASIGRMDRDTVTGRGNREEILKRLEKREIDILVGTQMITKGHDFPHINLIGVISADMSLNIPDFRAAERTFQLLTQVSGRSGRGDIPGRVIIQTLNPDHYAVMKASRHDYLSFYEEEINLRKTFSYPPFSRMITLHLSAVDQARAQLDMAALKTELTAIRNRERAYKRIEVIGPTRSPIEKIRGRYRWQIILKGKEITPLHGLARAILLLEKAGSLRITADVDPLHFM